MNKQRTMRTYENLTIADDFIFSKVMQDESICAMMIESLLGIKVGRIEYIESQKSISLDYDAKGVRFDIYVKDSDKIYDIEMQTTDKKNLLYRYTL